MNNLSARFLYAVTGIFVLLATAVDAAPQKDLMLVLDNSGSMKKNDPNFQARGAVEAFINKLDAESRAGVLIFDHGVKQAVPLTVIDDAGKATLIKSLENINYRGQLTDSPAAVERAIYELKTNARDGADRFIVFMTDGIVDTGKPEADVEKTKWLREELAVDAADNGIKVFAIAFTEHADFFLIQSLAKKTNGEYFRALTPADLTGVFDTVHGILNEPPPPPPIPEPAPPIVSTPEGTVVTPIPDDTVTTEALAPPVAPEELLASLSPDERLALEEISQETGIPIEQLALELVGPDTGVSVAPAVAPEELLASLSPDERLALEEISQETGISIEQLALELVGPDTGVSAIDPDSDGAVITYPEDEITVEDERMGLAILAAAAVLLLLLVVLIVWFVKRRRSSRPAALEAATASVDAPAIPEAFINDVHGYTDDPAIQLTEKPLMVGRVAGTDTQHLDYLVVNKGTVGRRHAVIKYKDFSFWIVDQGSVNGTFVNAERISGEQQLKHGDTIRFHKYDFDFSQPEMDDGFHTVFADPNAADATIVASASTLAATSAMGLAASIDEQSGFDDPAAASAVDAGDADDFFGSDQAAEDPPAANESPSAAFADAAAFADSEVFDITGETEWSDLAKASNADAVGDVTYEENATIKLEAPLADAMLEQKIDEEDLGVEINLDAVGDDQEEDYDDDDEDLGVEINLDTLGEEGRSNLILDTPAFEMNDEFDADASAFFEDITVGPTPDDDMFGPTPDVDDQLSLDAKLEQATAILDRTADGDFGDLDTLARTNLREPDDPMDLTLDEFIETDSFDAPETIPPAHPNAAANKEGDDVSIDAFMSTSMFETTNEDETVLPEQVPDDPKEGSDIPAGDTVVLPSSPLRNKGDDDDDDDSEDPTVLR